MFRPDVFKQPYCAIRAVPYLCGDGSAQDSSGGVLGRGQTVWTKEAYESKGYPASAVAFVDGVGIVSLDTRWLVRADIISTAAKEGLCQSY
jgi:hypothetical protein